MGSLTSCPRRRGLRLRSITSIITPVVSIRPSHTGYTVIRDIIGSYPRYASMSMAMTRGVRTPMPVRSTNSVRCMVTRRTMVRLMSAAATTCIRHVADCEHRHESYPYDSHEHDPYSFFHFYLLCQLIQNPPFTACSISSYFPPFWGNVSANQATVLSSCRIHPHPKLCADPAF